MNATSLFKALLEASWQGSLVIILILALRPLLGARVPAAWRNFLWLLVLVRLLVPGYLLPSSPASMENLPVARHPVERAENAMRLTFANSPREVETRPRNRAATIAIQPEKSPRDWWRIAALIWAAGAAALALRVVGAGFVLHRRIRRDGAEAAGKAMAVWQRCLARFSFSRAPQLVLTTAVDSPALIGLFHPKLLLPRAGCDHMSEADWQHVFLHELAHYRRRDHWLQMLQLLALCAHWFNPLVWLALRYLRADRELAADEWALKHLGEERTAAYGETLLKLLGACPAAAFPHTAIGILEGSAQMKQRLRRIVAFRPRRLAGSLLGGAVALTMAAVVLGQQTRSGVSPTPTATNEEDAPAPNEADDFPKSILAAARAGNAAEITRLIEQASKQRASLDATSAGELLDGLVRSGDLAAFNVLLKKFLESAFGKDWQPDDALLAEVVKKGRRDFIDVMLASWLDPARLEKQRDAADQNMAEWITRRAAEVRQQRAAVTQLVEAAGKGDLETMRRLLDAGTDVNGVAEKSRHTPLTWAADKDQLEAVRLLLERGAEVDKPKHPGWDYTPLCLTQSVPVAELLKKYGANVQAKLFGRDVSILTYMTRFGGADVVEWMIKQGVDPKAIGDNRQTLLFDAKDARTVEILLAAGLDPNHVDEFGQSPLTQAPDADAARKLIAAGAKVSANKEFSILQAVQMGGAGGVEVMIEAQGGIAPDVAQHALISAADSDRAETAKVLLAHGAKANETCRYGGENGFDILPLQLCASSGSLKTAKVLLDHGADPNAGKIPGAILRTAIANGHKKLATLLRDAGAKGVSDLAYYIAQQDEEKIGELLKSAPQFSENAAFWTAAMPTAARLGDVRSVRAAIGKNVPLMSGKDENSFAAAAFEGQHEVLAELLAQRKKTGGHDDLQKALWNAVWNSYPYEKQRPAQDFERCVKMLLESGAEATKNPTPEEDMVTTAVFTRNPGGNSKVLEMLVAAGADPNPIANPKTQQRLSEQIQLQCRERGCSAPFARTIKTFERLANVSIKTSADARPTESGKTPVTAAEMGEPINPSAPGGIVESGNSLTAAQLAKEPGARIFSLTYKQERPFKSLYYALTYKERKADGTYAVKTEFPIARAPLLLPHTSIPLTVTLSKERSAVISDTFAARGKGFDMGPLSSSQSPPPLRAGGGYVLLRIPRDSHVPDSEENTKGIVELELNALE